MASQYFDDHIVRADDGKSAGKVLDSSREKLIDLIRKAKSEGADSLIFGCTEICMILPEHGLPVPAFDSTDIHAQAAVAFALENDGWPR